MRRALVLFALLSAMILPTLISTRPARAADSNCFADVFSYRNYGSAPTTLKVVLYLWDNPDVKASKTYIIGPGETLTRNFYHAFDADLNSVVGSSGGQNIEQLQEDIRQVADRYCAGGGGSNTQWLRIDDGRINDGPDQLGAPLAGYCLADGSVTMWDIADDGHGTLGFTSTAAEIANALAAAKLSGQNQLIGSGLGNSLYALVSGELELRGPDLREAGKLYQFIAPGNRCVPTAS